MTNSNTRWWTALACAPFVATGADALRPLSTDRPDTTESPYTVDAGHFQVELEIAAWERDGGASELTLGEWNLKYGVGDSTDIQFVVPTYVRDDAGHGRSGPLQFRVKHNLWGNDGEGTALALMPWIGIPTRDRDEWEGGLIVPLALAMSEGWGAGVMTEVSVEPDDDGGHRFAWLNSATISRDITANGALFAELVLQVRDDGEDTEAYFNTGWAQGLESGIQLDGGIRVGLTDAAADFTPFIGISQKF